MSAPARDLLRFVTAGSVDDGKSTLIGRLLHDAGALPEDHLEALRKKAGRPGDPLDFSLVTDGLKAEREQGITIDVAYRYFETPRRRFIIADTPGHEQYTRNMATGASTADLAVLLVDARAGVLTQSRRHGFIASLLGVPRVVVAVNKMDLAGFDAAAFERVRDDYQTFAARLGFAELRFIPVCAFAGDNVVSVSARMPWYRGPALLQYLEEVYVASDANLVDLRFPVQSVLRAGETRHYAGTVASGVVRPGDTVAVLPSGRTTKVKAVHGPAGPQAHAHAAQAVALELEDDLDAGRGDMIAHPRNAPRAHRSIEAMVIWMSQQPLEPGAACLVKQTTRTVRATCASLAYRVDPDTLRQQPAQSLAMNDVGRVTLTAHQPIFADEYARNRGTGGFILIDPQTRETLGAGMLLLRQPSEGADSDSRNIRREASAVDADARAALLGQRPLTIWLTGLPGAGKSTLARELERRLHDAGRLALVLDGDNLRHGLNRDLGFSPEDRRENIRRTAEAARLLNEAGVIAITALISPYRDDRSMARAIVGDARFLEVHVDASAGECERRDPKGLWARARRGEIRMFTGVDAPYEAPEAPAMRVATEGGDVEACADRLLEAIASRLGPGAVEG